MIANQRAQTIQETDSWRICNRSMYPAGSGWPACTESYSPNSRANSPTTDLSFTASKQGPPEFSNIVPVFGVGEHAGIFYYAMQYIQGQGLDRVLPDATWVALATSEVFKIPLAPHQMYRFKTAVRIWSRRFRSGFGPRGMRKFSTPGWV
jgi:hypothetical protein